MLKLKVSELVRLANVKSEKDLFSNANLKEIAKDYKAKIEARKNLKASYVNQKSQVIIKDNCFVIENQKFTTSKIFSDSLAIDKSEVLKLQSLNLNYDSFKKLFKNVSKFILCNYNVKNNIAKHERFYSQCLAEVNLILKKKFTAEIIHSRSKNIKIKQITFDNVEKKHQSLMQELLKSKSKAKIKTAKLVKAKVSKKAKAKV